MKKTGWLLCVTMSFAIFFSCKKSYECSCTTSTGGHEHVHLKAASKSEAESECKAKAVGSYTACELE
jgi:hypothetical protein